MVKIQYGKKAVLGGYHTTLYKRNVYNSTLNSKNVNDKEKNKNTYILYL